MAVLLLCDSFKHALRSDEVNAILAKVLNDAGIATASFRMSDGGEGFCEAIAQWVHVEHIILPSFDPMGRPINSSFAFDPIRKIAYIELANCSGIQLLEKENQNPLLTNTYGTGLQIVKAIQMGAGKVILGLGGSATHDCGIGILAALGFVFYNQQNEKVNIFQGNTLDEIHRIIFPGILFPEIEIWCDVQNPLIGETGAAYTFAEQKGANKKEQDLLEQKTKHFVTRTKEMLHENYLFPGSAAAGGTAYGLVHYLKAKVKSGIHKLIELGQLNEQILNAELIITGEGKLDHQSFQGKIVGEIIHICRHNNKKCIVVCGQSKTENPAIDIYSLEAYFDNETDSITFVREGLKKVAEDILYDIKTLRL